MIQGKKQRFTNYMKKVLKVLMKIGYFLSYVWFLLPIVSYHSFIGTFVNMEKCPAKCDFHFSIFLWTFLLYIIATLFLIQRRKLIQFCLATFVGIIIFLAAGFLGLAFQSAPTDFAERHPIPQGLKYYDPKGENEDMEKDATLSDSTSYLQVRNSIQFGIYEYSFFYPELPEGTIYLQCYEVTENLPLSKRSIKKETSQKTDGTDHFTCLVKNKRFTIYEGDWNKYYAARIEVWFKDKKGHKRKLSEKTYIVQGWMR